jgi:thiosulfate/3-mercaptopyruvate sulfurtransferase
MIAMSAFSTLIDVETLATRLDRCVVVDCRNDLFDRSRGRVLYGEAHIPGAWFLSIDDDLASPKGDGRRGRHPLPERQALRQRLEGLGLSSGKQLVVYDADNGSFAARLWWLARWLGHPEVAVLDGGYRAWVAAGYPVTAEPPRAPAAQGRINEAQALTQPVPVADIVAALGDPRLLVIDARAGERYRGETEPLDPVAGHIPGALNRPFPQNLRPDGRFKPAEVLRAEFAALLGERAPDSVVHQCGSGVTACHQMLAMEHAGLSGSRLYAGSWSEWCQDPARPVARGA